MPLASLRARVGLSALAVFSVDLCAKEVSSVDLDEIVVTTGTRTEKSLENSPVQIDVVSGVTVDKVSSGTLERVLELIPGVTVQRSQKEGYNIMLQGFDGDRVLVLVDGMRLVSPTGASVDFGQLSALDIERIEVVRGASSVLYGSEAMGGVINIITRDGLEDSLRLSQEVGVYSDNVAGTPRRVTSLRGNLSHNKMGMQLSLQTLDDPSFKPLEDELAIAAALEKELASLRFSYNGEELQASYRFQSLDEYKYKVTGIFPGGTDDYYLSDVSQTTHSATLDVAGFELKAQHNRHDEESGNRGSLRQARIDMSEIDSQFIWDTAQVEWVAGLHYYLDGLDQTKVLTGTPEVDDKSQDGVEGFLQADWQISDALELISGLRLQEDSGYGSHSALRFSGMFTQTLSETQTLRWRAGGGQGYRVPTIKERYYVFDHSNLGYMIIGSEELLPEESISANGGLEWTSKTLERVHSASISVHASQAEHFITTVLDPETSAEEGIAIYRYENVGAAEISGVDLEWNSRFTHQQYQLSYNYLDARNEETGNRLEDRPYHQVKANASYDIPGTRINVLGYVTYQKDEAVPEGMTALNDAFSTVNFVLSYQSHDWLGWRVNVDNLFNTHKSYTINQETEFDPRPEIGRYIALTVDLILY